MSKMEICCDNCCGTEESSSDTITDSQRNHNFYYVLCNYFDLENSIISSIPNGAILTGLTRELAHSLSLETNLENIKFLVDQDHHVRLQDHYKETIMDISVQLLYFI